MFKEIFLLVLIFSFSKNLSAQKLEKMIATDGIVWGFDFLSQSEMIYTLKKGEVYLFNLKLKKKTKLKHNINSQVIGQGGLLDIAVYDQKEKIVYLTYTKKKGANYTTALAFGRVKSKKELIVKEIFSARTASSTGLHFGSRIVFDRKNKLLYISIGDRGVRDRAQNLGFHNGKIIRLKLDASVPKTNPFFQDKKALKEIYSYGHRNPQGLYFYQNELWEVEFGPRGGDEINLIEKGKNYGWPLISYGREYWGPKIGTTHKAGMMQPLHYYVPSISPSGMMVYEGKKFPQWQGDFFLACLASHHLRRVRIKNMQVIEEEELFKERGWRIRQVKNGPLGGIYFSTDFNGVYRLY